MPLATRLSFDDVEQLKRLRAKHYERPADMLPWQEFDHGVIHYADVLIELAARHFNENPEAVLEWHPPLSHPLDRK